MYWKRGISFILTVGEILGWNKSDGISDNMASLVESVKYRSINTTDTTTNVFYIVMFISEAYTIQDNTTLDRKIYNCWGIGCYITIYLFYASRH